MRDRLIELTKASLIRHIDKSCKLAENIADDLLENGVIVPPCNIGDALYYPVFATNRVLLYKVISIKLNSKGLYVVCENCLSKSQMTHRATQIGETIFLTKIEAESALAERRNECEYIRCRKCRHSALTSTDGELYCFKENKIVRCEDSCGCAEGKIGQ